MSGRVLFDFSGKRCLVTGAGKGIGRECVQALVRAGANVFALSRTQADLDSLEDEMKQVGKNHLITTLNVDIADWNAARDAVEKCLPVDFLVNNAGVGNGKSLFEETSENIDNHLETNFKSMVNVTQVVADRMIKDNVAGSIVNVSSLAAIRGTTSMVYSASKGAMDAATRSLAVELGSKGIRVNSVNPTFLVTRMTKKFFADEEKSSRILARIPLGEFPVIDDVVDPILFLLSDGARMINGASIPVDGGQAIS